MDDISISTFPTSLPISQNTLDGFSDFADLTEIQKKVLELHFSEPELNKRQIAARLGFPVQSVYTVFHSKAYEKLNLDYSQKEKLGLVPLAVQTIRHCLTCNNLKVRMATAIRVLEDVGLLQKAPSIQKTDNKMIVMWADGREKNLIDDVVTVARDAAVQDNVEILREMQ